MSIPSTRFFPRRVDLVPMLGALALMTLAPAVANAQTSTGSSTVTSGTASHKTRKGNANQPAPTEHQAVQPSQRLQDEPNQVKEQVAPTPDAPVKPGSGVSAGQDTPKPQSP